MTWFIDADIMEQKTGFLTQIKLNFSQVWPQKLTFKNWRAQFYNHYFGTRRVRETWWRKLLVLWVLGWLVVCLWILWFMNSVQLDKRKEILGNMCDERARMLQDQFNVSMNHLQALAILVSTFHHAKNPSAIDQATFARYAERTAFERPLTSGVAYAVKVLHSDRDQFEKSQGWTIKKMYSSKKSPENIQGQEISPNADEYAPVIFAQDAYKHVISLDMLSGHEDRENILRARESGKGVLTAPFPLVKSNRLGVILTYAVYKSELPINATPSERIKSAIGYLGGIFDIEALVDKLLHQLACKQAIMVNVYDTTKERVSMYGADVAGPGVCHVSSLNFGDPMRKHQMHCRFTQKPPPPWLAITTSFGTLVIALLIGHIFYATVNRIAKVEDDFRKMMELKKRAEAADVAKSQFLATVSHEIRTPMNGVLGMLQMLMDTYLDVTQQDYVRTAQASGKALVSLINEVLDQAKIESGKLELEAVPFDIRVVLDDILSLFCGKAQEKGLELAVFVSDEIPETLIGDPNRMRQIITNLIGNSIKFTERGHIYLTVNLVDEIKNSSEFQTDKQNTLSGYPIAERRRSYEHFSIFQTESDSEKQSFILKSSDEVSLIISVEDTGVGIPTESQSRVFTPFMQVGPSISRIHGGTGIGLSISKCLVGLMKGEIGFSSIHKTGSTFSFTAVLSRNYNNSNSNEYKSSEFHGMNALIVDHRIARAEVTNYQLKRLGIKSELTFELSQFLPKLINNNTKSGIKMVLIDKETWSKESSIWPSLQPNLPKLFILASPTLKRNSPTFKDKDLNIIMKPIRASMLHVSLSRALFGDKNKYKNGTINGNNPSLGSLLQGKKILVVDDNIVNLRVAAGALKKYGAEVTCTHSGKRAIGFLKPPHDFDACFMDIQMPEMDGFEATKRIREMETTLNELIKHDETSQVFNGTIVPNWHIPILAMTADVIQATHEQCLKSGMDGYVSKPFEGEQLYREVARFFKSNTKLS